MTNWICDAVAEDYSEKDGLQSADFAMLMGLHFAGKKAQKKTSIREKGGGVSSNLGVGPV